LLQLGQDLTGQPPAEVLAGRFVGFHADEVHAGLEEDEYAGGEGSTGFRYYLQKPLECNKIFGLDQGEVVLFDEFVPPILGDSLTQFQPIPSVPQGPPNVLGHPAGATIPKHRRDVLAGKLGCERGKRLVGSLHLNILFLTSKNGRGRRSHRQVTMAAVQCFLPQVHWEIV
jgi:hypothetical protein